MARVLTLIPDLLFGSQVQGGLVAAGHDVELTGDVGHVEKRLAGIGGESPPAVLVIDLDSEAFDGVQFVRDRRNVGALEGTRTLGFYPHVDVGLRARAQLESAGLDVVVPRSRMAREAPALVDRLLAK